MDLKEFVSQILTERERNVRYMARKTGLSHSTIHRIINGFTNLDMDTVEAVAKFCNVTPSFIYQMARPISADDKEMQALLTLSEDDVLRDAVCRIVLDYKEKKLTLEQLRELGRNGHTGTVA